MIMLMAIISAFSSVLLPAVVLSHLCQVSGGCGIKDLHLRVASLLCDGNRTLPTYGFPTHTCSDFSRKTRSRCMGTSLHGGIYDLARCAWRILATMLRSHATALSVRHWRLRCVQSACIYTGVCFPTPSLESLECGVACYVLNMIFDSKFEGFFSVLCNACCSKTMLSVACCACQGKWEINLSEYSAHMLWNTGPSHQ